MKRGEIYFADLNPTVGNEINKRRPVLIVSNDANNRASSTITVLPITSNTERVYPFEVKLTAKLSGLPKESKVLAQQIRTISRTRHDLGKHEQALMHGRLRRLPAKGSKSAPQRSNRDQTYLSGSTTDSLTYNYLS